MNSRVRIGALSGALILLAVFLFAPIVPYSQDLSIPGNYVLVRSTCPTWVSGGNTTYTTTVACLKRVGLLPAVGLRGLGSLSFSLTGYGSSPFPSEMVVRQGNLSALVYFQGGEVSRAESLCCEQDPQVNPVGVVTVLNPTITLAGFGELNFTVSVENVGGSPISAEAVFLDAPGLTQTATINGTTWIEPLPIAACYIPTQPSINPGQSCTVHQLINLAKGGSVTYYVEVRGTTAGGEDFVYRQRFTQVIPSSGIGPSWVNEFVQGVNNERASPLVENSSLDGFASARFVTASSKPDISDYNFTRDAIARFGSTGSASVSEVLLFPGGFTPSDFASYLQRYAPGHWSALTNPKYSHFGYYVGQAPYYQVSANCAVQEVLGEGVNMTQYFQSQGCQVTPTPEAIWLVIVMAP